MPGYFHIFQNYLRKKLKHTGGQGTGEYPESKPPIPKLGINTVFRQRSFSNRTGWTKYLFEFDIAAHALVIVFILAVAATAFLKPSFFPEMLRYLTASDKNTAAIMVAEETFNTVVAKQVYASEKEISAQKIFSVDPGQVTLVLPGTPRRDVYGFFPYWMLEREEDVSLNQLSDIALFGLDVDGQGNILTTGEGGTPNQGWQMWNDPKLTTLITRAKRQRIAIEVTIKNFDNDNIESLIASDDAQKRFIANAIYLVESKSLNGINIDFEYIGTPDLSVRDGFTRMITNLRSEMQRQIPGSSLTIDTYATAASIQGLFDIEKLAEQTDALIIMGYDIHTPSGSPGPVAPLEGQMSLLGFLQSYLEKADPSKIILAVPYYGYDWDQQPGAQKENHQMLSYAEIVDSSRDKTVQWDDNAKSPFYVYTMPGAHTERIVHFENVRSLGFKYDLINAKNLRGVGIWALGYDGRNTDLQNLLVEKFAK